MTEAEFLVAVDTYRAKEWYQRHGQAMFNVLWTMAPDVANEIRETDADPFHRDDRIEVCLEWLRDKGWFRS